jgi:hypothetical protein
VSGYRSRKTPREPSGHGLLIYFSITAKIPAQKKPLDKTPKKSILLLTTKYFEIQEKHAGVMVLLLGRVSY